MTSRVLECEGILVSEIRRKISALVATGKPSSCSAEQGLLKQQVDGLIFFMSILPHCDLYSLVDAQKSALFAITRVVNGFVGEWTNKLSEWVKNASESGETHWEFFHGMGFFPTEWNVKSNQERKTLMESPLFVDVVTASANYSIVRTRMQRSGPY
jgi:hypothetical protein